MNQEETKEAGQRKALGRGLAALIPQSQAAAAGAPGTRSLPIEKIRPNRVQPRKHFEDSALDEMAASIKARGVIQPIIVRRQGDSYEIVAGERRWRAAARAGLHEIPCTIKELGDSDSIQVALIENLQREDLDPLEAAEAFSRLMRDHGLTQDEVADVVGKSRAAVANTLRLLRLPTSILHLLADGKLTAGHARALMTLAAEQDMLSLATDIVQRGLSVRDAEQLARQLSRKPRTARSAERPASEVDVEERLQRSLGTKTRLRCRRGKGRIEIFFYSLEQLSSLMDRLAR